MQLTVSSIATGLPETTSEFRDWIQYAIARLINQVLWLTVSEDWYSWVSISKKILDFRWIVTPTWTEVDKDFFKEVFKQKQVEDILQWVELAKILWKHIDTQLPDENIFSSHWATVVISSDGEVNGSYDFSNTQGSFPWYQSVNEILRTAFEQAYFYFLMNFVPTCSPMNTKEVQERVLSIIDTPYSRGWYHNATTGETYGNSGAYLHEGVVKAVLMHFYPEMSMKQHSEEYNCPEWVLLAGVTNELISRLSSGQDSKTAVKSFLNVIKKARESDSLWLLH